MPAYYCPAVVDGIVDLISVRRYDSGPLGPHPRPEAGPGDAVITVSYFGEPPLLPSTPAAMIIDVTHDQVAPWLDRSRAAYVFASLYKTLPLPDGGMLWSGNGRPLPPAVPPTEGHLATVSRGLSAMCLKTAYLDGAPLRKEEYLPLYAAGDAGFRSAPVSGISDRSRQALHVLPAQDLRRRRIAAAELASCLRNRARRSGPHPHLRRGAGVRLARTTRVRPPRTDRQERLPGCALGHRPGGHTTEPVGLLPPDAPPAHRLPVKRQ